MSTLAVIPARLGAVRLPRKPLRLLGGSPLVVRVWEHVMAMNVAERVVVATDAEEIAAVCAAAGAEAVMTRADHASGTDRVSEVARSRDFAGYDVVVNVQGDEPFLPADAVRGAVDMVTNRGFEVGTAAANDDIGILNDPMVVKVVVSDAQRALYFSRAPIPFLRDSLDQRLLARNVRRHLGVYATGRDALFRWVALEKHPLEEIERLEQLRALAHGMTFGVFTFQKVTPGGIDTEEDLAVANATWDQNTRGGRTW
jgi:3-deoxy-manno-octulosonate cytidylyltransferase (CMP-KDO synthetase)